MTMTATTMTTTTTRTKTRAGPQGAAPPVGPALVGPTLRAQHWELSSLPDLVSGQGRTALLTVPDPHVSCKLFKNAAHNTLV